MEVEMEIKIKEININNDEKTQKKAEVEKNKNLLNYRKHQEIYDSINYQKEEETSELEESWYTDDNLNMLDAIDI